MTRRAEPAPGDDEPIRIGVSSCLLGNEVRFDGGHKRNRFLLQDLGPYVDFVAVCPEVELGMGIPRPTLRLERTQDGGTRMIERGSGTDHTSAMRRWSERRVRQIERLELCGYVLKKDSPSCGMTRVKVYETHNARRDGVGIFAESLRRRMPELPVEEEGRLNDPRLRENFIERVFAYRRLKSLFSGRWGVGSLVAFHTAHKLQLLAHSPEAYRSLGRLVAEGKKLPRAELRDEYRRGFMQALSKLATPGRNTNVLQHMAGYVRKQLDAESRTELGELIEEYRQGLVPLVVPLTLLRHHVRRLEVEYLADQVYLEPHPKELMLRNHV